MPTQEARRAELIVGGNLDISEDAYVKRLGKSITACVKMLKRDRWMSVVFQHWNTAYFDAILSSAAEAGADLRAAVPQVGNTIWSMHKKKGNQSVLAGELILTFCKNGQPRRCEKSYTQFDIEGVMTSILSDANTKLYGEHLFNQLILAAWNKRAISSLDITKDDFNEIIRRHGWRYDEENHYWVKHISENTLFAKP
jgi:hypothetical protein